VGKTHGDQRVGLHVLMTVHTTVIRTGSRSFPGEIFQAPRSWVEQGYPNVIYFNEVDKGGHFAAWEEPELFSDEVRAAFRSLR
jgi:pimeloyl-ACP methyl ester carboxylesterase